MLHLLHIQGRRKTCNTVTQAQDSENLQTGKHFSSRGNQMLNKINLNNSDRSEFRSSITKINANNYPIIQLRGRVRPENDCGSKFQTESYKSATQTSSSLLLNDSNNHQLTSNSKITEEEGHQGSKQIENQVCPRKLLRRNAHFGAN